MREIVLPPVACYRGPQSPLIYYVLIAKNVSDFLGPSPNWPMRKTQILSHATFICIFLHDPNSLIDRAIKLVVLSGKHKFYLFSLQLFVLKGTLSG